MIKSPVTTKVQPSPERLAVQMKFMERRYDDVLTKVLEQNALILNSVARMQDDLKNLRTKLESLELSVQEETGTKINGIESSSSSRLNETSSSFGPHGSTPATSGLGGHHLPPATSPFTQPPQVPFYNPYAQMYNPYMMMPFADPLNYLVNPATMQYAAMYGALNQNAPPAVTEPSKALPGFSFGVSLPTSTATVDTTASSSINISFAPPKSTEPKKIENGISAPIFTPPTQAIKLEGRDNTVGPAPAAVTPTKTTAQPISTVVPATPQKSTAPQVAATPKVIAAPVPTPAASRATTASTTPVFGTVTTVSSAGQQTASNPSIFGTVSSTPSLKSSLFSSPSSTNATFGTSSSSNITFGTPSSTTPLFGTPASSTSSIFPASTSATPGSRPTFTFGMSTPQTDKVDGPVFSTSTTSTPILPTPGSAPTPAKDSTPSLKKDETSGASAPTIDFSALAAKASMCSFGEIAKASGGANENPFGSFKGFGSGASVTPVFGSVSSSGTEKAAQQGSPSAGQSHEEEDDFVPTAEFAPVIPLPPLVEVKKGDENENVLFSHRAKLFRLDKEAGEYKERGLGDIKILQAKDDPKKIRVVMWREKVHKIACNHWVTKEIKVSVENPKGLKWVAIDCAEAEGGPRPEIFYCRFGQEDAAKEFKKQMEYAVSLVEKAPGTPQKSEGGKPEETKAEPKAADSAANSQAVPLSQMFKKPEGTWTCQACYTDNKKESNACAACTTPNPNAPQVPKAEAPATPKFTFGFNVSATPPAAAATVTTTKVEEKSKETPTFTLKSRTIPGQSIFGTQTAATTPTTSSLFGSQTVTTTTATTSSIFGLQTTTTTSTTSTTGSIFGSLNLDTKKTDASAPTPFLDFSKLSSAMPSFGNLATTTAAKPFSGGGGFGSGTVQPVFGAPAAVTSDTSTSNISKTDDDAVDDFVPTAEFAPVIPLPPLVEVKKGDEDEKVLFQHRAKLYRFVKKLDSEGEGEWKERGVGDIKILQDKQNPKKIRIVMWREKVHKIACNHWVSRDLEVTNFQGNSKTPMWTAIDFAEAADDPKSEIFVCRFGQEDKAQEFKREFEKAIQIVKDSPDSPEKPKEVSTEPAAPASAQKPLSELFKKAEGDWSCDACYCTNSKDSHVCVSCSAARPGSGAPAVAAAVTSTVTPPEEGKESDLIRKAESLQLPSDYFTQQIAKKPEHHPPCRGCEPDSFDFSLLEGRKVPNFEDIPKPQRDTSPKESETLKALLMKGNNESKTNTPQSGGGGEAPKSALSSFSFSLPSPAVTSGATSSTPELKINAPTFSFTPNFTFTPEKTSVVGSSSIFGGGLGGPGSSGPDSNVPTTVESLAGKENPGENGDEHEEEEDEDDEDEDPMFLGDGHAYFKEGDEEYQDFGEGHVKILYDGDHFCARFWFVSNTDEDLYVDHIIAAETQVKPAGENAFEWDCISYNGESSTRARVKVEFPDQQTYDQFSAAMADSVDIAMQAGLTESDLVNGSADDSQD